MKKEQSGRTLSRQFKREKNNDYTEYIHVRKIKSISGSALLFLPMKYEHPLRPVRSAVCLFSQDAQRGGQRLIKALFSPPPRFTCNPWSTHCHGNCSGNCAEVTHGWLGQTQTQYLCYSRDPILP